MADWIGKYCIINDCLKPVKDITEDISFSKSPVYEVLRVEDGVPLFLEDHFSRLQNSFLLCQKKLIVSLSDFRKAVAMLITKNKIAEGPVKFIFRTDNISGFIAYFMTPHRPSPEEYKSGINTVTLYEERNNPNAKIWNTELRETATTLIGKNKAYEAILINKNRFITEGSRSNIFFIKNNTVYTTPEDQVLPGITRKNVLEICLANKIKTEIINISYSQISDFESAFLTGTSRKVVPIRNIDNIHFDSKNKLMRKIMKYFDNLEAEYIKQHKQYYE